jgi:hypothetical protein
MTSSMAGAHRSSSNPLIPCELEHSVVWNRIRGSGRVLWWWRRYLLVARGAPTTWLNSDVQCYPTWRCYEPRWRRWNALEELGAHHKAVELIGEAGDGQEEEINGGRALAPSLSVSTGSFPPRLAWRGEGENHSGASEMHGVARGCLYRSSWSSLELGFGGRCREDEQEKGERILGFQQRWSPFYTRRRAAAFILGVQKAAADQASSSAPPSSLPSRGRRWLREAVCGNWVGLVLGFSQVTSSPIFFHLIPFIFI